MSENNGVAKEVIRGWLQENVSTNGELSDGYPLIEKGILTSLQTVELVMFVEERFGITVEDEDMIEENFATLDDIAVLVENKGG